MYAYIYIYYTYYTYCTNTNTNINFSAILSCVSDLLAKCQSKKEMLAVYTYVCDYINTFTLIIYIYELHSNYPHIHINHVLFMAHHHPTGWETYLHEESTFKAIEYAQAVASFGRLKVFIQQICILLSYTVCSSIGSRLSPFAWMQIPVIWNKITTYCFL